MATSQGCFRQKSTPPLSPQIPRVTIFRPVMFKKEIQLHPLEYSVGISPQIVKRQDHSNQNSLLIQVRRIRQQNSRACFNFITNIRFIFIAKHLDHICFLTKLIVCFGWIKQKFRKFKFHQLDQRYKGKQSQQLTRWKYNKTVGKFFWQETTFNSINKSENLIIGIKLATFQTTGFFKSIDGENDSKGCCWRLFYLAGNRSVAFCQFEELCFVKREKNPKRACFC